MSRRTEQALREQVKTVEAAMDRQHALLLTVLEQNQRLIAAVLAPSNPVGASVVARRERPERPPVPVVEGL